MKPIVLAAALFIAGCATPQAAHEYNFDESFDCLAGERIERLDDGLVLAPDSRVTCVA